MTTARSPLWVLKEQADTIAKSLKMAERGETLPVIRSDKLAAARMLRESVKFGVVMDDKTLMIEITWAVIRATSEAGIAEYILGSMLGARDVAQ
jgi:hypothetical protein